MAETGAKQPDVVLDEEAKQLKLLQTKAEARKAIAEAETATIKAAIPEVKPVDVTSSVDLGEKGGASLASVVAAAALSEVAGSIGSTVSSVVRDGMVMIVEDRSVAESDVVYLAVTGRLQQFSTGLSAMTDGLQPRKTSTPYETKIVAAAPGLAVIAGLGGLVANIAGLFKSDLTVRARDVTVSRFALIAEIMQRLIRGSTAVVLPGFAMVEQSAVFRSFNDLLEKRYRLERVIVELENREIQPTNRQIDGLVASITEQRTMRLKALADGKVAEAEQIKKLIDETQRDLNALYEDEKVQNYKANVSAARSLLAAFDAFALSLTSVPTGARYAPLVGAVLREQLRGSPPLPAPQHEDSTDSKPAPGTASGAITHLLYVEVSSSGADVVTRSGILGWRQKAAFLGAVQASYILASSDGTVMRSGAVTKTAITTFDFKQLEHSLHLG